MKVAILCAGVSAAAELDQGIWRCTRCGKHVRVVIPDEAEQVKGAA